MESPGGARRHADLMHVYFGHTGVHLLPFIQRWTGPVVVSFHGMDVQTRAHDPSYESRLRDLLQATTLVLARSQSLLDRVQEKHTNARGTLHGGVLASIADIALGYGLATSTDPPTSMVTANLSVDFAGSAQVGDWIETALDLQKIGSRLAFANVYFTLRGERIARASGVFLVVKAPNR